MSEPPPRRVARPLVALRNTLTVEPALWRGHVRSSFRLAREAQRRGAVQKLAEFAPLLALLDKRRPSVVVELGTYRGGSFYGFCKVAAPDALLVSIDLPGGLFGGGYSDDELEAMRTYALPGQKLHFLRADSHADSTRDAVVQLLKGRPLDFLMIDGDHRLEGVRRDFDLYASFLAGGGLIAFHDILPHPDEPLCQVDIFWRELKQQYEHVELIDRGEDWGRGEWGGIGVIRWPKTADSARKRP